MAGSSTNTSAHRRCPNRTGPAAASPALVEEVVAGAGAGVMPLMGADVWAKGAAPAPGACRRKYAV